MRPEPQFASHAALVHAMHQWRADMPELFEHIVYMLRYVPLPDLTFADEAYRLVSHATRTAVADYLIDLTEQPLQDEDDDRHTRVDADYDRTGRFGA